MTVALLLSAALAIAPAHSRLSHPPPAAVPPAPASPTLPAPASTPPPAAPHPAPARKPLTPFPHPIITEVLYAVPTAGGDANADGARQVAGDEFVELANPHDRPIQLRGYRLTDRNPAGKGQLKFVFPDFELPPGGVVVIFNGNECRWRGPVGDSRRAPDAASELFHNAFVFTMRSDSQRTSWSNTGDYVLLCAPGGEAVECVCWGKFDEPRPAAALTQDVPVGYRGSVARLDPYSADFSDHTSIAEGPFSPGLAVLPQQPAPPPASPAPVPSSTPASGPPPSAPAAPPSPGPPPRK
ncbi:MAG TPA: lamin tail domain-containing protein [Phycisphaerales bacterium]|nr:lamin tail domain-containing protein [Phycisphaerales bacterium]